MTKRKRSQMGLFRHLWNEFLFARYFEYETDLAPVEVAANICDLASKQNERFWRRVQTAHIEMYPHDKGLDFEVQRKRKHPGDIWYLTTARTQGNVIVDGGTGKTIVRGSVSFGRIFHLLLVLFLSYFIFLFPPMFIEVAQLAEGLLHLLLIVVPTLVLGLVMGYYWWRIYTDRNLLAQRIEELFTGAVTQSAVERLAENVDTALTRHVSTASLMQRKDER